MVGSLRALCCLGLLGLLAVACQSAPDGAGGRIPALTARIGDAELQFHDLGSNTAAATEDTVATAPVWVMIRGVNDDGSLDMVEGQRSIFDVRPGDDGYSDLWQVTTVTVPQDYEPNAIRSYEQIEASGYPVESLDMFVNCPIVAEGTSAENGPPLVAGWVDGEDVYYFDFGLTPNTIAQALVLTDEAGPEPALSGRDVEFDSGPEDDRFSPFRRLSVIRVPQGSDITSLAAARAAGLEPVETGIVLNLPVTSPDQAQPPASTPYGEAASGGWIVKGAIYAVLVICALAIAGALLVSRGRPASRHLR